MAQVQGRWQWRRCDGGRWRWRRCDRGRWRWGRCDGGGGGGAGATGAGGGGAGATGGGAARGMTTGAGAASAGACDGAASGADSGLGAVEKLEVGRSPLGELPLVEGSGAGGTAVGLGGASSLGSTVGSAARRSPQAARREVAVPDPPLTTAPPGAPARLRRLLCRRCRPRAAVGSHFGCEGPRKSLDRHAVVARAEPPCTSAPCAPSVQPLAAPRGQLDDAVALARLASAWLVSRHAGWIPGCPSWVTNDARVVTLDVGASTVATTL